MYSIVYADPPWSYGKPQHGGAGKSSTGGAHTHYQVMALESIKEIPVSDWCNDDALLFMWTSSPHLQQAMGVIEAWGFKYATIAFVWDKQKVNPGSYTMSQIEICLVAKRGKIPQPRGARNIRQFVSEMRGRHSAKPAEVRSRIDQMFPDHKKLEMFARTIVDGWDAWGDEAHG